VSRLKANQKRQRCLHHREVWYERTLDRLINGQAKPGDVTLRYQKLKEIRG